MKRLWVITLIFCLLLIIAYPFRWDKGPVQTEKSLKIIHLRDRWVGQNWIAVYGSDDKGFYSGEQSPHFSSSQIDSKANLLLMSSVGQEKRESLQNQLNDVKQEKEIYSTGHSNYVRLYEQMAKQYDLEHPIGEGFRAIWQHEDNRREYVSSQIPEELKKVNSSWKTLDRKAKNLAQQINDLPTWAKEKAKINLTREAYNNRDLATYIWIGLVGISFIVTVVLFSRWRKTKDSAISVNKSKTI